MDSSCAPAADDSNSLTHRSIRDRTGRQAAAPAASAPASRSANAREPLFHPRDFALLGNCQAIVLPYDGKRANDARRCYLKPDFLPRDRPYWRAREAGEL